MHLVGREPHQKNFFGKSERIVRPLLDPEEGLLLVMLHDKGQAGLGSKKWQLRDWANPLGQLVDGNFQGVQLVDHLGSGAVVVSVASRRER